MNITPRLPRIDWSPGFPVHWHGDGAAATHAFNALSFLFPQAERYFIEVAREVARCVRLGPDQAAAIQAFVTQESLHTQQHRQYNAVLRAQGFENVAYDLIERLQAQSRRVAPLTRLAIVCAYEHYTAILGHHLLRHPELLAAATPELALVWGWHAAEETEHKSVCFDLYRAAGGGWWRRVACYALVSLNFQIMYARLYLSLLYRDGALNPLRIAHTIAGASRFFWGRNGVGWALLRDGLSYLRPGFHPDVRDSRALLRGWLTTHQSRLRLPAGKDHGT